jgi:hypothetical protein
MEDPIPVDGMLTEGPMDEMLAEGRVVYENEMVEKPTEIIPEETISEMLNNLQERVRRLRPRNPIEIGDDLP